MVMAPIARATLPVTKPTTVRARKVGMSLSLAATNSTSAPIIVRAGCDESGPDQDGPPRVPLGFIWCACGEVHRAAPLGGRMAWLRGARLRWAIAGVVLVVLVVAAIVAWPYVQRYTGAAPPAQFYQKVQPEPALAQDYPRVLGGARNTKKKKPTLAEAWDRAAAADTVKLDLKQTDRGFLNDLVAFLAQRARSRRVMISSGDRGALLYLHGRLPDVTLLFSVAGPDAVHQLQSDPALQEDIGGVSVFKGLVDADLITWVHRHKLLILAWTVNDSQRLNQLVRLGVDGITTANLAFLRALS